MSVNRKPTLPGGDISHGTTGGRGVNGAYALYPAATPKYLSVNGRTKFRELTVARLYLSGGNYDSLPGVAPWFSVNSYVGFLLQEVTERSAEKSQIIPMNGDGYAAFFSGREPQVYSFSGVVLNTQQDQWRSTLSNLYNEVFRGSKVAAMNRMVQIAYDDKVVSGSMINLSQVLASNPDETYAKFSFDILVVSTYDAWMDTDEDFISAGNGFLGDKTIFPDVTRSDNKKGATDYVRTAYLAPPPVVKRVGSVAKCTATFITKDTGGNRQQSELSQVADVDEKCKKQKEVEALYNKADELNRRDPVNNREEAEKLLAQADALRASLVNNTTPSPATGG